MDRNQSRMARRSILRRLAVAGALGVGGMAGLMRAALAAKHTGAQSGIRSIKGTVTVDGQPASIGQQIKPGQTVTTGPESEAVFVIGKDAFLQQENSEFGTTQATGVVVLRYITGKVLSVFGKGRKRLETPTATIGIRGTGCFISAGQDDTYFCLCYGTAVITPKDKPRVRRWVRTKHHDSPFNIGSGKTGAAIRPAKDVVDHTDEQLVMLEELVGRAPPFVGKGYSSY
ncbi:hypothetical protein [Noviherbaspirillum sp. ST9]|uniref:hypothetical protein n=1 Tax=Noviherbaspirillum sp. ST9 TaxID=3401606 RepID=UPI003B585B73